jgi:hypothetical protein
MSAIKNKYSVPYSIGDYVALISNDYNISDPVFDNLGTVNADGTRNIGRVVGSDKFCVKVQFGGEKRIANYDPLSLGFIIVHLAPDAVTKNGVLSETKISNVGVIMDWDNYGTGNNVTVKSIANPTQTTVYPKSDLIFDVNEFKNISFKTSGGRRITQRRDRVKRFLTRFAKRV